MPPPPDCWTQASPYEFGDIDLLDTDVPGAVASLANAALSGEPQGLHLCNAYTLSLAMRDPHYRKSLQHPGAVNLPDGTPVTWYFRLASRSPVRGPVRGPGLLRAALARPGLRHYLLGGTEEVLADLQAAIAREYPQAEVVGAFAPRFGDPTESELDAWAGRVCESGANLLWIGLGTPRQDHVIAELTGRTGAVAVGVGAAFDFLSGHKAEAPKVLHDTGLEWLHRLASEPRRLWRRYLFGNAAYLGHAARQLRAGRRSARLRR